MELLAGRQGRHKEEKRFPFAALRAASPHPMYLIATRQISKPAEKCKIFGNSMVISMEVLCAKRLVQFWLLDKTIMSGHDGSTIGL